MACRADWRFRASGVEPDLELCDPPAIPTSSGGGDHPRPALASFGGGQDFLDYQQSIGVTGNKQLTRANLIDGLAECGSEVREADIVMANSALCRLYFDHTKRLLADKRWCDAFARATSASGGTSGSSSSRRRRVLVFGVGSGVAALSAARAGCTVVWLERVHRYTLVSGPR